MKSYCEKNLIVEDKCVIFCELSKKNEILFLDYLNKDHLPVMTENVNIFGIKGGGHSQRKLMNRHRRSEVDKGLNMHRASCRSVKTGILAS